MVALSQPPSRALWAHRFTMASEVLWRGRLTNPALQWGVTAAVAVMTMLIIWSNQFAAPEKQMRGNDVVWFSMTMMIVVAIVTQFSTLITEVRRAGFYVQFGVAGIFRRRIAWENVAKVELIMVRPTEWGGWGYRWVPWRKGTAAVLRKGPGLKFDFANGKVFVVTIDDAENALAAIRRVLDELPPA
jgi:hypothetical protein